MTQYTIGVDISKAHIDVHLLPGGKTGQFANDRCGFCELIKWIGKGEIDRIVYEPAGACHRRFEDALSAAGLTTMAPPVSCTLAEFKLRLPKDKAPTNSRQDTQIIDPTELKSLDLLQNLSEILPSNLNWVKAIATGEDPPGKDFPSNVDPDK